MSQPEETEKLAAFLVERAGATPDSSVRQALRHAASLLRSQALKIQKAQAEREQMKSTLCIILGKHKMGIFELSEADVDRVDAALASPSLPTEIPEKKGIQIGDRIRFSVSLLRQIYEEPDHVSISVEVVEVKIESDGCKWISVKRIDDLLYVWPAGSPVERTER